MTAIPTLTGLRPRTPYTPTRREATAIGSTAAPSAIVHLSAEGSAAASQAAGQAGTAQKSPSVRFRDVGAAMLEGLKGGAKVGGNVQPVPKDATHGFTLSVATARGTKVDLSLAARGDDLVTHISADAELGGDERAALAALAGGFQDMIDGMTLDTPKIRLGALAQLDTTVLQSIDLHAAVTLPTTPPATQTLGFHIDARQRSMQADGPAGKVDVTVKTSVPESLGTSRQQARAIDGYLKQFDQAAARGHADAGLVTMFKDAFADLSRTASRDGPRQPGGTASEQGALPGLRPLAREDKSVLTGLADFSARISQTPRYNNPVHRDEVDSFEYEVSQQTRTDGKLYADRSLGQVQQSRLKAQFHAPLREGMPLAFDFSAQTQNYQYHQVDDMARSSVDLAYRNGRLRSASMEQTASQSERIREYVLGRVVSDETRPAEQRLVRDLLAALSPYQSDRDGGTHDASSAASEARRLASLDALGENFLLLGNATDLSMRAGRFQPVP
ncbi:hypothetical protein ACFFTM_22725 [Pseudoduganella plicata]|uniref:Lactate dehydrogenase n=1 Tax=Pseudoduganella plicata TaxID=321984 RepID=A0A4P7BDQ7_9BURK|nr:hypothetical protein [Pseudoduganella plicata]QBQ36303.1 hypothetical protein E1742_09140 [Pseudoduganella plicata]GGY76245.1 hypothetical protein GCM10007388_06100 [Pseudoduganella plicata]